ncbi:MAG: SymE family type I addiction module toxin, partial [Exilibacterium sp.]
MQEPSTHYQLTKTKQVTVQSTGYPPLKTDSGAGAWRKIPWINLRGFWLKQAGFEIGAPYSIDVYERKLVLKIIN